MGVNFNSLTKAFNDNIQFAADGPPAIAFSDPFAAASLAELARTDAAMLPKVYQDGYAAQIAAGLPQFVARLKSEVGGSVPDASSVLEPYLGAIYDRAAPTIATELNRFQAVISDLYDSFLSDEQRAQLSLPLIEQLPPLATFAHTADQGPFTIPSDDVLRDFGAQIGVVSLPSSYRAHPIVWAALCHEVGGHDVLHADPGLLAELRKGVVGAVGNQTIGRLFAYWMDEAASDVYGLLNIGPTFVFNLAAFFTALVFQLSNGESELGRLDNRSFIDQSNRLDVHPTDLLRVDLAIGVIESLHSLDVVQRSAYVQAALALAESCGGNATTIDIVRVAEGNQLELVQSFPLTGMRDAARRAGAFIANTTLKSLGGHSIQEIETWDDGDEEAAQSIKEALLGNQPVSGMGDDAQVLAGATSAVLENGAYQAVTAGVNAALDASFKSDGTFGLDRRHHIVYRPWSRYRIAPRARSGAPLRLRQARGQR